MLTLNICLRCLQQQLIKTVQPVNKGFFLQKKENLTSSASCDFKLFDCKWKMQGHFWSLPVWSFNYTSYFSAKQACTCLMHHSYGKETLCRNFKIFSFCRNPQSRNVHQVEHCASAFPRLERQTVELCNRTLRNYRSKNLSLQ